MVENIEDAIENQEGSQDSNSQNNLIFQFFGKEKPGCVRGYGLGMTPTRLWGSFSKSGGPSASEFSVVEGKLKEMEEKMKEKDAEMEQRNAEMVRRDAEREAEMASRDAEMTRRDAERDAEMARRDAEMADLRRILLTLNAQARGNNTMP